VVLLPLATVSYGGAALHARLLLDDDGVRTATIISACKCRPLANRSGVGKLSSLSDKAVRKSPTDVEWRGRQLKRRKCMVQQADPRPRPSLEPHRRDCVDIGPVSPQREHRDFAVLTWKLTTSRPDGRAAAGVSEEKGGHQISAGASR
jgi:hypothetical protein